MGVSPGGITSMCFARASNGHFHGGVKHDRTFVATRSSIAPSVVPAANTAALPAASPTPAHGEGAVSPTLTNGFPARIAVVDVAAASHLSPAALLSAIDHLMTARPDPVYLVAADGRVWLESPTGALARANMPGLDRVLAGLVGEHPSRAEFFVRPDLGVGLHVSPCSPRGAGKSYLVSVTKLAPAGRGRLTQRQAELISLLQEGMSNAQIARRMGIAPSTVKTMLERLYRFANVSNRQALVHWASGARVN